MRKLYVAFPNCTTLSCNLSWSHYVEILKGDDPLEISFYAAQCTKENWSVRELRRQRNSMLFHRLALSKDKEGIIALATEGQDIQRAEDVVKDPYVLEFLTFHNRSVISRATWNGRLSTTFRHSSWNWARALPLSAASIR